MDENRISFLAECDSQAKILYTFWYQPIFLISPYQKMLGDLFCTSQKERIMQMVSDTFAREDEMVCEETLTMISPEVDVSICMLAAHGKVLVLGFGRAAFPQIFSYGAGKDILHRFMKVVCASDTDLLTKSEITIRDQFEQIHKLNNDLVNTQRQLKKLNQELRHLNTALSNRLVKDPLTGLVSRYQYGDEITRAINADPGKLGIFTFLDLDEFKAVNDNFGHKAGDQFLKVFAQRLTRLPFENLICMRIAGDEFGLYIHGYEAVGEKETGEIWEGMMERVLNEPIDTGWSVSEVRCSAGMAVYGRDTDHVYELIDYADFAMYEAKKSGKNKYSVFDRNRYGQQKTAAR